ncbi:autolysin, partial [Staphylococcus ureilyticus]
MTNKKLNYKVPSIVALTLAGTALTTHYAHAADNTQNQKSNKNVLNDENTLKQSEEIKSEVSNPTTNISGTQTYNDPSQVQELKSDEPENYDAQLDELNKDTSSQNTYSTQNQENQNNSDSNKNTDAQAVNNDVSISTDVKTDSTNVADQNDDKTTVAQDDNASDVADSEVASDESTSGSANDNSTASNTNESKEDSTNIADQNDDNANVAQDDNASDVTNSEVA